MILFLTQFTISTVVLFSFYMILMKNDTFFRLRRYYLLGSILFSLVLPFVISLGIFDFNEYLYTYRLVPIVVTSAVNEQFMSVEHFSSINLRLGVMMIYLIGVIVGMIKLLRSISQLYSIISNNERTKIEDYVLVNDSGCRSPFSFFNYIVCDFESLDKQELDRIILHEREHVDQLHSVDILIMELICVLFWFHPIVYLFKKQIRINHEFEADQRVISQFSRKAYGHILLKQSISGNEIVFANYFFQSFIKKRINMMYNTRTNKSNYFKYGAVLPLIIALVFIISNCSEPANTGDLQPDEQKAAIEALSNKNLPDDVYKVVEEMPRFPGCEDVAELKDKEQCAKQKMLQYIYQNLKYPKEAKEKGVEGTAVVRFIVDKTGDIRDVKLLRDVEGGCGEAAKAAVERMNNNGIKWIPGQQSGKKVSVAYTLPIKFKLQ